jgi:hypothetical protein
MKRSATRAIRTFRNFCADTERKEKGKKEKEKRKFRKQPFNGFAFYLFTFAF